MRYFFSVIGLPVRPVIHWINTPGLLFYMSLKRIRYIMGSRNNMLGALISILAKDVRSLFVFTCFIFKKSSIFFMLRFLYGLSVPGCVGVPARAAILAESCESHTLHPSLSNTTPSIVDQNNQRHRALYPIGTPIVNVIHDALYMRLLL